MLDSSFTTFMLDVYIGKNETIYYIHWLQHCIFIQIVGQCLVTVTYGLSEVVPVDNADLHFSLIYIAWQS